MLRAWITAVSLFLLWPVRASATPIVFSFEDGLQGWELDGSAQRIQTQVLGEEWAISGDGLVEDGASISIEIDLTEIASVSLEQFFAGDAAAGTDFLQIWFRRLDLPEPGPGPIDELQTEMIGWDLRDTSNPSENPGLRVAPVPRSSSFPLEGVHEVKIKWGVSPFVCTNPPLECHIVEPDSPDDFLGFVDNITFHEIPEPSTTLLLALGLAGIAGMRREKGGP
jgi:hypothetical protein